MEKPVMKKVLIDVMETCSGHEVEPGGKVGPCLHFKEGQEKVEVESSLAKQLILAESVVLCKGQDADGLEDKKSPKELREIELNNKVFAIKKLKEVLVKKHEMDEDSLKGFKKSELIDEILGIEFPDKKDD